MFSSVHSLGLLGIDSYPVTVETDLTKALPAFEIVGLPDAAVRESRDRVQSACRNCGFPFPVAKITVNLAPADIKKAGPIYDLPILISILAAAGELEGDLCSYAFVGELSLSGEIRAVNGILPMVLQAKNEGYRSIFLPQANAAEGAVVRGIEVYAAQHVKEVIAHLKGTQRLSQASPTPVTARKSAPLPDFAEVKGQQVAKRAIEIAAAGGHNILLLGPPGSGKSMLAKRVPSILPPMTFEEQIETTKIHSVSGEMAQGCSLITERPFRAPHHTISPAGLSGGGSIPKPGEISLAHNGVLFLDEFPEFSRSAMEILRQPIEDGTITLSRAASHLTYPCSVMLIAAMNPCKCGYFGHPTRSCTCTPTSISKYLSKVSGPMLDRLDLHVEVMPVEFEHLRSHQKAETSAQIRERVSRARKLQQQRYQKEGVSCNARLRPDMLDRYCSLSTEAERFLRQAFEKLSLSARAYDRIVKVSRTIADLEESAAIEARHIAEAVQYRSLDRKYWHREL